MQATYRKILPVQKIILTPSPLMLRMVILEATSSSESTPSLAKLILKEISGWLVSECSFSLGRSFKISHSSSYGGQFMLQTRNKALNLNRCFRVSKNSSRVNLLLYLCKVCLRMVWEELNWFLLHYFNLSVKTVRRSDNNICHNHFIPFNNSNKQQRPKMMFQWIHLKIWDALQKIQL